MSLRPGTTSRHRRALAEPLAEVLRRYPPFDALGAGPLGDIAAAATVESYAAGRLVLDAFVDPSSDVFVVLSGSVDVWNDPGGLADPPDEQVGPGGVFGFSAMLTERSVGPRVVAAEPSEVARIPGDVATPAFVSTRGARFLAQTFADALTRTAQTRPTAGVGERVGGHPLVVEESATAADVARAITADGRGYAAVRLRDGTTALVTDASLRRRVIVEGVPGSAPVTEVLDVTPPVVDAHESVIGALTAMVDSDAHFVVVTEGDGSLRGVASLRDVAGSPGAAGVTLHERLRYASTVDELADHAVGVPGLLGDLLHGGLASGRVISAYSSLLDAIVRRAIELAVARHPDLPHDAFTWLDLGSTGRREAVLSSDLDSAAVFVDGTTPETIRRWLEAFGEVHAVLARAGLSGDSHGAVAARRPFARTAAEWRAAARRWIAAPTKDQGAMMISLLLDGRPVHGAGGLPAPTVLADLRRHPETIRVLLEAALAPRARFRSVRELVARGPTRFDIKRHAILPVVNLARWAALDVGSTALGTVDRLHAAAGSAMLPESRAGTLIEAFSVLQRLRLRYQLMQHADGQRPSDEVTMEQMSAIDRSVIAQAVREITAAQRRMANVSAYVATEEWALPEPT